MANRRGGGRTGGVNFSSADLQSKSRLFRMDTIAHGFNRAYRVVLLSCIEELLPRGQLEWKAVATKYNLEARVRRDVHSLRNKFKGLGLGLGVRV
jgi:hypothetical protein